MANEQEADLRLELHLGLTGLRGREGIRFYRPALDVLKSTDLWEEKDYPAEFKFGGFGPYGVTYNRKAIFLEFASALLLRGYILTVQMGEGCESLTIPLASYPTAGKQMWRGGAFTKTQYAREFVRDHTNVCHILDLARAEGLLQRVNDNCGFYKHRDWRRSAPIINRETDFISAVSTLFNHAITSAQTAGAKVQVLSDPIKKTKNYIIAKPRRPAKAKGASQE